jgi:hypothetical protein
LITAKSIDNSSSYSAEHDNGIQQAPLSLSDANNSSLSRSITAVAVKAVATTDGFFQTVRYEGLQAVDGGSAGAAMTILLMMSELQSKSNLNQTVFSLPEPSTLMGL